jgi:hypothetical protein
MLKARVNGDIVVAEPDSPEEGFCPDCGGKVRRRHRTRMDGDITYFYRHIRGEGKHCPRRYRPTVIWHAPVSGTRSRVAGSSGVESLAGALATPEPAH